MNYVVLLAGGKGTRVGREIPKQFIAIKGRMLIEYSIASFSAAECIDSICVVADKNYLEKINRLKAKYQKLHFVVTGGDCRSLSVLNGIKAISLTCNDKDNVIVSDSARPCITTSEIESIIESLSKFIAVTSVLECYETLLGIDNNKIDRLIARNGLFRQTSPEGYKFSVLKNLYINNDEQTIKTYNNIGIDQLLRKDIEIGFVKTTPFNFKITTEEDLILFECVAGYFFKDF